MFFHTSLGVIFVGKQSEFSRKRAVAEPPYYGWKERASRIDFLRVTNPDFSVIKGFGRFGRKVIDFADILCVGVRCVEVSVSRI